VNYVRCHITIAKGKYNGRAGTEASVLDVLQRLFSHSPCEWESHASDGDDVAVEGEVMVRLNSRLRRWGHDEAIRDRIATALVNRLQPEYESQVEVEIANGPDESVDRDEDECESESTQVQH